MSTVTFFHAPQSRSTGVLLLLEELGRPPVELRLLDIRKGDQLKSEFLASMSHELRTPLNAVLGFTQLMRDDERLPPDAHDHLAEVDRAGQHLLALVNDLIDLARIESGRMELSMEPVGLADVLGECVEMVTMMARERGVQVVLQTT